LAQIQDKLISVKFIKNCKNGKLIFVYWSWSYCLDYCCFWGNLDVALSEFGNEIYILSTIDVQIGYLGWL
jgi:hypothetical protein